MQKKICVICHKPFETRFAYRCCSMACAKILRVQTRMANRPDKDKHCLVCGRLVRFHSSGKSVRPTQKYCSRKCANKFVGEKLRRPSGPCPVCGKLCHPSKATKKCCSVVCGHIYRQRAAVERRIRTCLFCGRPFVAYTPSYKGQFCSQSCAQRYRFKDIQRAEKSYPVGWKVISRRIRKRDSDICRICKIQRKKYSDPYAVHHIDYDKTNCASANLVTLCPWCHNVTSHHREYWKKQLGQLVTAC